MSAAPRRYLDKPDDLVVGAFKRLRGNSDFDRIYHWLAGSLVGIDETNRHVADAVAMRQNQGAAAALGEFLSEAEGKSVSAVQTSNTRQGSA